eukprot:CAMPEP_0117591484 /NCGR_PEP_ID=MMETSP0784-20121206/71561_1 /TAXON_ID=39447 /ORGANISM="" /LENGTH=204 /DNA_ID=CAMNT_0005393217 /DNA_START=1 /DNA_END=616 /DNA_ORIENTATION=+
MFAPRTFALDISSVGIQRAAAEAEMNRKLKKPKEQRRATGADSGPFLPQDSLDTVFYLYADRKTKLLPLADVPQVLRACGLTVLLEDEGQFGKIDGLGKPITFQTLQSWLHVHKDSYTTSSDDAYNAVDQLRREGIIKDDKSDCIEVARMRRIVSNIGDRLEPDEFDRILSGSVDTASSAPHASGSFISTETCSLDTLMDLLRK